MVNVVETQPGHKEGRNKGNDDGLRRQKGIAPRHFLKAPSKHTHFVT